MNQPPPKAPQEATDWLKELKVGDEVVLCSSLPNRPSRHILLIGAATDNSVMVDGAWFFRATGREHFGGYDRLIPVTPRMRAVHEARKCREEMARKIRRADLESLPFSILEQINALLETTKTPE